jgi:UDP-glucose 4-epimerase
MRYLVTGASGMIGSRLIERIVERHGASSVTAMTSPRPDPQERGRDEAIARLGVKQVNADLLEPKSLKGLSDFDVVFHLAAELNVALTDESDGAPIRVNDTGTANLIAALGPRLNGKLFIYTSSIAVVDQPLLGAPATEETPCRPRTVYGRTKLRGEEIVKESAGKLGFRFAIFRLGTVYGPNCRTNHVFDLFTRWVAAGALKARVDWPGRLSLIFVDDAAGVLLDSVGRHEVESQTFFLASPEDATVGGLARAIAATLGKDRAFIKPPAALVALANRALGQDWFWKRTPAPVAANAWRLSLILSDGFWCDMTKLLRIFPEKTFVEFREGVQRSLACT